MGENKDAENLTLETVARSFLREEGEKEKRAFTIYHPTL